MFLCVFELKYITFKTKLILFVLSLLKIKNIALIDELSIEFGDKLNLLTGETGSGKSIIVDSLGALTGERVSSDLIKEGEKAAQIEGLFLIKVSSDLRTRIKLFLDNNFEQLEKDISKLPASERVRFLIKLMEFVVPKQKSMELNAIDKTECIKVVFKGTGVTPITSESEL